MNRCIYVVFSRTPGKLGKMIRIVTWGKYNHVSLALDPDLRRCWSFARIHETTPLYGGFVHESPLRFMRRGVPSQIMICKLEVDNIKYDALQHQLRIIKRSGYIYNTVSALAAIIHRRINIPRSYTCVEFVVNMLQISGIAIPNGYISVDALAALLSDQIIYSGSSAPFCRSNDWGDDAFPLRCSRLNYAKLTLKNFARLLSSLYKRT